MNFYVDTSVIVSAITNEAATRTSSEWLESAQASGQLFISQWVSTEVQSALALKCRMGLIDRSQQLSIAGYFKSEIVPACTMLSIGDNDLVLAQELIVRSAIGLRSSDALHLAIASRANLIVATHDLNMFNNAKLMDIGAVVPKPSQ